MHPLQNFPSAVLLDMDGTLFDSEAIYKRLWQQTAHEFDIDLNDEVYVRFVGARYDQCLQYIQELGGSSFNLDAFLQSMAHSGQGILPPLKPGALAFIEWLEKNNISKALVTSSRKKMAARSLNVIGGLERFQVVITGDDVKYPKPSPEPYLLACEEMGISPETTLAVEDSNTGALSAIEAGCQTVVVPDVLPIQQSIQERCLVVIQSLEDLPNWIAQKQTR